MSAVCDEVRGALLDRLVEDRAPARKLGHSPGGRRARMEEHLRACAGCAAELRALGASWRRLPASLDARPPIRVRERVLARASGAAGSPAEGAAIPAEAVLAPEDLLRAVARSIRRAAGPILLGMGAAALVLLALGVRGGLAPADAGILAGMGLVLAAAMAVVAAGILDRRTPGAVRSILVGGAGALAGYLALTLVSPIPASVEFCRVTLLGGPSLAVHELCVIYLAVAAVYAGMPTAAAAWLWAGKVAGPRAGLLAGIVFLLLATPTLLVQVGPEEWLIALTLVGGAAAGALLGGAAGGWAGRRPTLDHAAPGTP